MEALYKAIHPLLPGSIPWHSVTVWPASTGDCLVDASALEDELAVKLHIEAEWKEQAGAFVSIASARLLGSPELPVNN